MNDDCTETWEYLRAVGRYNIETGYPEHNLLADIMLAIGPITLQDGTKYIMGGK